MTADQLNGRLNAATEPPGAEKARADAVQQAEVDRLARLDLGAYDREREEVAKRLGVRVSVLDRLAGDDRRKKAPASQGSSSGQGSPLKLVVPEPWPQPVEGHELLDEIEAAIRSHLVMAAESCRAMAL